VFYTRKNRIIITLILILSSLDGQESKNDLYKPTPENFRPSEYKKYYVPELQALFLIDDLPDNIKLQLKEGIYWEADIGNLIKHYVRKDSTVVDIGAHIGIHSITMSRKTGPRGTVFAFEPQSKLYYEHLANMRLNGCNNVLTIQKALGNYFGTVCLDSRNIKNEGATSIGEGGDLVDMIPLDSLNLSNVSLIKVDVERFEWFVFQGARETILRNKPVLIFEVMGEYDYKNCSPDIKREFDKTLSLVKSFGYSVTLIYGNDYLALPF
jgi:FkbM family methyltransferase